MGEHSGDTRHRTGPSPVAQLIDIPEQQSTLGLGAQLEETDTRGAG